MNTLEDETLNLIAPQDRQEASRELRAIENAEREIDRAHADWKFWNEIANIFAEAKNASNDIIGRLSADAVRL